MKGSVISAEEAMSYAAHVSGVNLAACLDTCEKYLQKHGINIAHTSTFVDSVAIGTAALSGKRVFLPTMQVDDSLSFAVSMRLPLVCASFSYDIGNWPVFATSTLQELIDTIVQAYKIAENKKVLLPIIVTFDGYPSVREAVHLPSEQSIRNYVGKHRIPHAVNTKKSSIVAPQNNPIQDRISMQNIFSVSKSVEETWKKKFHRFYGFFESYKIEDAETVLIAYGFNAPTVKAAVDVLRKDGQKIGMLRLRIINPLPPEIEKMLEGKRIITFDNFLEHGVGFASAAFGGQSVIFERHLKEEDVISAVKKGETSRLWVR